MIKVNLLPEEECIQDPRVLDRTQSCTCAYNMPERKNNNEPVHEISNNVTF